jgi:hypothetical protein
MGRRLRALVQPRTSPQRDQVRHAERATHRQGYYCAAWHAVCQQAEARHPNRWRGRDTRNRDRINSVRLNPERDAVCGAGHYEMAAKHFA